MEGGSSDGRIKRRLMRIIWLNDSSCGGAGNFSQMLIAKAST